MTRTIKFKGKRIDNGKWVYGSLAETHGKLFIGIPTAPDNPVYMMDWHEVDSNTIGQFTGLLDKNGREIYEGDVLSVRRYDNEFMSESEEFRDAFNIDELKGNEIETITDCVFHEEASFYVGNLYLASLFGNQKHSNPIHEFEIIGNIYNNPTDRPQTQRECKHYQGGVCARSKRCYRPCLLKSMPHCPDFTPKTKEK